jgi:hypothetical protein
MSFWALDIAAAFQEMIPAQWPNALKIERKCIEGNASLGR